jgi:excisionase family DNA binding protein
MGWWHAPAGPGPAKAAARRVMHRRRSTPTSARDVKSSPPPAAGRRRAASSAHHAPIRPAGRPGPRAAAAAATRPPAARYPSGPHAGTSRRTGPDAAYPPRPLPRTTAGPWRYGASAFAADLTTRPGGACMHPPHGHPAATDTNRPRQDPGTRRRNPIVAGDPDELLTLTQVAAELKVSREALYRWRRRGTGPPSVRLPGGTVRIRRSALSEWLRTLQDPFKETAA